MADTPSSRRARRRFAAPVRARLALGSIAVASVGLAGCDDTPPDFRDAHFTSVSECVSAGFPDRLCEGSYNAAWQSYLTTAPQFANVKACEAEWGDDKCVPQSATTGAVVTPSGGNVFVPLLAGFMVSQALQRRYYDDDNFVYYGGGYGSPIYRNRKGATVQLDTPSAPNAKAIARPVNVNTVTVARSGFGGSGRSRGFGG